MVSNVNPAARKRSARRGEAEASTNWCVSAGHPDVLRDSHGLSVIQPDDKIKSMRPLQHAIPGALLTLLRDAPLSDGKVGFAWRAAVGPALQRATHVKLEGNVLLVDTTSAQWSREVMRSSPVILRRLQELLGADTVARIEVRRA
jgi:predicted nucleic acid-binding Zn ribbon protein